MSFVLDGYVDVAERIRTFKAMYPQGSLQPANLSEPYKLERIGDRLFIIYIAAAYRTPDDERPGIGMAMEPYPGRTNYTKDSELMNAETSAWGRAIVAALAADTQKIASAQEVRNRQADREAPAPRKANPKMEGMPDIPYERDGVIPFPKEASPAPAEKPQRAKVGSAAQSADSLSEPQRKKIQAMWRGQNPDGVVEGELEEFAMLTLGRENIESISQLTKKEASLVIEALIKLGE
jgi:hypothetical protein